MACNKCGEKPKKGCGAFPKAVIEIDNPEKIVLLRKVMVPASMGDESAFPPAIGKYHNVLLEYEASGGIYLYSSDGIPTKLSSDTTELQAQLNALRVRIGEEEVARAGADTALSNRITSLDNSLATVAKTGSYNDLSNKPTIGNGTLTIKKNGSNVGTFTANATANKNIDISVPTKTSDLVNDGSDGASQYVENDDLAAVATSGSYNDLTNKPTIGNATLTIKRNNTSAGTFTANATTNKSIDIAVPTKTSDLTNDGSDGASTYVESDDLPTVDTTYSSSSNNAIANSTVTNSLDRNVMTNLALDSTPSTTTVSLNNTKTNLAYPSSSTTSSIPLPVASSTQAGVMNSATFDAVANNTSNINAIMNGAVAISNLPASPTQAQLTTAWENETGLPSLINRASVYDVTNNKVWTYYTNDQTWHAASNTSQVTVNTFTNSSEGTIKGSTNDGQVFAESDGTGSVNGWDALNSAVSSNTSKLATIAQGAEVNVQSDWTQTNTSADDYIKNKPANLVQDANYVHTDNNFTTTLKNKLGGIESGAEVNVQADWSQTDTTADDYIKNKPTIPTVNNATLTIQKNGTNVQTFTANSNTNKTANITVPTAVSELTNDSGYATTTQLNSGLATKQDTLTAGDNIQINGNTISATDTTYTAGNAIDITNGEISADIHPADFFTASDSISDCGSNLSLDDTMASTLESVELKGDTYQQTYSGANLFDYTDISETIGSGITTDDDGWITCTVDNSAGTSTSFRNYFTKPLALSPSTQYVLVLEVLSVSGTGAIEGGGSNSSSQVGYYGISFVNMTSGSKYVLPITSRSDVSGANGLRMYFRFDAGQSGSITMRVSVLADTSVTPETFVYQPYVGGIPAPNPDYPQDIQVVTGEQTVKVTGKNLFPLGTGSYTNQGLTSVYNADGSITVSGTADATYADLTSNRIVNYEQGKTYTVSITEALPINFGVITLGSGTQREDIIIAAGSKSGRRALSYTHNIAKLYIYNLTVGTSYNFTVYPMVEEGSTATAYQPYQSQTYPISLGSIELCKIGNYQDYIYKSGDDWYLHKACNSVTLVGTENWNYNDVNTCFVLSEDHLHSGDGTAPISNYFIGQANVTQFSQLQDRKCCALAHGDNNRLLFKYTAYTDTTNFKSWLSTHNTTVYYALATPDNILIEDPILIAQLDALAGAKSYNDQTNIVVTAAGDNLPATLCVEAYRKSLSGVIEAIDSACTCRKNLVVHLPNGMTTYTNDDAPILISEVSEAFKRGQSVFLVDDAPGHSASVYTVTAVDMDDGIYSMRADQTGISPRMHDGHWHISGDGDVWDSVTFINDTTPKEYSLNTYNKTWSTFTSSTPLLDQNRRTYYPASSDVTFNNLQEVISVAELWEKLASSAWSGNPVILEVPLQEISEQTTNLVNAGYGAENPYLTTTVSLGPDSYFERETSEHTITGWAAECTPITFNGKESYMAGIVRVVENGNTTYSFVVSLTEVAISPR